jgi:hypothetical protein
MQRVFLPLGEEKRGKEMIDERDERRELGKRGKKKVCLTCSQDFEFCCCVIEAIEYESSLYEEASLFIPHSKRLTSFAIQLRSFF